MPCAAPGESMTSHQAGKGRYAGVPAAKAIAGAHSGPTVPRIALGAQLRRLREASNITAAEAADAIRATHSKISRLERGRAAARQRDVADLLTLYGVTDEAEREKMLVLARQGSIPGWWHQYSDVLPRWLELYIGLEKAASMIRAYELQFIHGRCRPKTTPAPSSSSPTPMRPPRRSTAASASGCSARTSSPSPTPRDYGLCWTRRHCAAHLMTAR